MLEIELESTPSSRRELHVRMIDLILSISAFSFVSEDEHICSGGMFFSKRENSNTTSCQSFLWVVWGTIPAAFRRAIYSRRAHH
jgi:hypothetical protein